MNQTDNIADKFSLICVFLFINIILLSLSL